MPDTIPPRPTRLLSLDALRGFDMLWIVGGDTVVFALANLTGLAVFKGWATQLHHVRWEGVHALDLIFPLFMFFSGVAIPFALDGKIERGETTRRRALVKVLRRAAVLVILGAIYNGTLASTKEPRLASVLGQIGLAYAFAATIHLSTRRMSARFLAPLGILASIAAAQLLFPVPGHGAGMLTREGAFNAWVDRALLPGRLYRGDFDPEGLVCIVSATTLTLGGAIAGAFLRRETGKPWRRAGAMALAGIICLAAGYGAWAAGYPAIKSLWTASFDLVALGWALVVFSIFHTVIDVAGIAAWSFPLRVVGMNAIAIYFAYELIPFDQISAFVFNRFATLSGDAGPLLLALGALLIEWLALYGLWRKKIFVSV